MDTIECIKARRSRRLFKDKVVSDEIIDQLLQCAITAPSSADCQPWEFVIVTDSDKKKALSDLKSEDNKKHILTAPVTIVVCVDTEKSSSRYIEDGVSATQNILLAAHALGIGSVYVTGCKASRPEVAEKIRDILLLPKNIMPITILPIGYPDSDEVVEDKKLVDLSEVVHQEEY